MGAGTSRTGYQVNFTKQEDQRLQRRFAKAAKGRDHATIQALMREHELQNPFSLRALQLFDADKDGVLTLNEFKNAIDLLGNLSTEEDQAKFAYRMFDLDESDSISAEDVMAIFRRLGEQAPDADDLDQVIHSLVTAYDADGDGQLSYVEFKTMLAASMAARTEEAAT